MSTPTAPKANSNWLPDTSHGFWRLCLLASLLINIVVAGVVIGGIWHHRMGPGPQQGFQEFVPGRFFAELDRDRRKELGDMLRGLRPEFEGLRNKNRDLAAQVATELEKPDYDPAKVSGLIDSFTTGPESLAAKSASALKDFYGKLSPSERLTLAKAIRSRLARKQFD